MYLCCLVILKAVLKSNMPSRPIAPAPTPTQAHIPINSKVPGHITVTIESSIAAAPSIPVATISGQQVSSCWSKCGPELVLPSLACGVKTRGHEERLSAWRLLKLLICL